MSRKMGGPYQIEDEVEDLRDSVEELTEYIANLEEKLADAVETLRQYCLCQGASDNACQCPAGKCLKRLEEK